MTGEIDEEISEIKKEIVESRNLAIKTNHLVTGLGADVKAISKRQTQYERRFLWNSGAVYLIIAFLSFAGLKLASDARIREVRSEMEDLEAQVTELQADLGEEVRKSSERATAAAKASRFYELIADRKRAQVVDEYAALSREPLSPAEAAFFRDQVQQFRTELSVETFQEGLGLFRNGRHKQALAKFERALEQEPDAAHAPAIKYQLARALRRLGRTSEALVYARQVAEQSVDRELQPDGWWLTAQCARDLRDLDTAREALRTLIRKWPRSSLSREARPLLRELAREAIRGRKAKAAGG